MSGRDYLLTFDWNQRLGQWSLLLSDQDDAPIRSAALVANWPFLYGCVDPRRPPGGLILLDTANKNEECTFSGLGDRWQLVYLPPEEM
jgi:hypothetical protein